MPRCGVHGREHAALVSARSALCCTSTWRDGEGGAEVPPSGTLRRGCPDGSVHQGGGHREREAWTRARTVNRPAARALSPGSAQGFARRRGVPAASVGVRTAWLPQCPRSAARRSAVASGFEVGAVPRGTPRSAGGSRRGPCHGGRRSVLTPTAGLSGHGGEGASTGHLVLRIGSGPGSHWWASTRVQGPLSAEVSFRRSTSCGLLTSLTRRSRPTGRRAARTSAGRRRRGAS
jgi:hypothetical protein